MGEPEIDLIGKTVLDVGGGRGIGRRSAELFSAAGANVVVTSRNEAEMAEVEYKLNGEGNRNVLAIPAMRLWKQMSGGSLMRRLRHLMRSTIFPAFSEKLR